MRDGRTYIRLDDAMPENPKIEALSDASFRVFITVLCWCHKYQTDGVMSARHWAKVGTAKRRGELVTAGLIEITEDGAVIHDYLEHQCSSEEISTLRERRRSAGRLGGLAKAKAVASAKGGASDGLAQVSSNTLPYADADEYKDLSTNPPPSVVPPRTRGTRIPEDFTATPEMIEWARTETPLVGAAETKNFIDYWSAESGQRATKISWEATWRRWMRKAQQDAETRRPRNGGMVHYDGLQLLPRTVEDLDRVKRFEAMDAKRILGGP